MKTICSQNQIAFDVMKYESRDYFLKNKARKKLYSANFYFVLDNNILIWDAMTEISKIYEAIYVFILNLFISFIVTCWKHFQIDTMFWYCDNIRMWFKSFGSCHTIGILLLSTFTKKNHNHNVCNNVVIKIILWSVSSFIYMFRWTLSGLNYEIHF